MLSDVYVFHTEYHLLESQGKGIVIVCCIAMVLRVGGSEENQ